jgi:hypothetical protein
MSMKLGLKDLTKIGEALEILRKSGLQVEVLVVGEHRVIVGWEDGSGTSDAVAPGEWRKVPFVKGVTTGELKGQVYR